MLKATNPHVTCVLVVPTQVKSCPLGLIHPKTVKIGRFGVRSGTFYETVGTFTSSDKLSRRY